MVNIKAISLKSKGDDYFQTGNYQDAIKFYLEAIKNDPQYLQAWNNLGFSYSKLGKTEEANQIKNKINEIKKNQDAGISNVENDIIVENKTVSGGKKTTPGKEELIKVPIKYHKIRDPLIAGILGILGGMGEIYNGEKWYMFFVINFIFGIVAMGAYNIHIGLFFLVWVVNGVICYQEANKINYGEKDFSGVSRLFYPFLALTILSQIFAFFVGLSEI